MFLNAAPVQVPAHGTGAKTAKPNAVDTQMAQFGQKQGIEKFMPWIVGLSGLLTIMTLTMAITDRYKKGAKK